MRTDSRMFAMLILATMACGHPRPPPPAPPAAPKRVTLAVLPAESDAFPKAAQAMTASLSTAHIDGIDATQISKVSLEVVQLSIECVDASPECYEAVGHSLSANQLLFGQIATQPKRHLEVTITLFDVDAKKLRKTVKKTFANEGAATGGIAAMVGEATQP